LELVDGDKAKAVLLFSAITAVTLIYYYVNNAYDSWSISAATNWLVAVFVYYTVTQPIYIGFLVLFTWYVYQQDKEIMSAVRGLVAAVLVMVSLDMLSIPHSIPSIFSASQTVSLPNDPSLAPYADYQLGRYFSSLTGGLITFYDDLWIYIGIPILLDLAALGIAKPSIYIKAVESA
jgi:hypothetical protein